jgi:hypothetical protein
MICEHIELTMESTQPRDIAKSMLKFWLYQAERARQRYAACKNRLEAGKEANKQALEEWRNNEAIGFWHVPAMPFSEEEIERYESRLPALDSNLSEANAMAAYIINYVTDKAHPGEFSS